MASIRWSVDLAARCAAMPGWRVRETANGYLVTTPNGTTSWHHRSKQSDWRNLRNLMAILRRLGLKG